MVSRLALIAVGLACTLAGAGCALHAPPVARSNNPIFVPATNREVVWERAVDVLHDYPFQIADENKLDGTIATEYKVGSGLLEPWHHESVGFHQRLESTLQPIRRRVFVRITPGDGGYFVGVEAHEEIEDVGAAPATVAGGASFQNLDPLQRDLDLIVEQAWPSGWVPLGRNFVLEQDVLARLAVAYGR